MKANEQASRCRWGRSLSPFGEEVDGASNVLAQLRLSRSQLETLKTHRGKIPLDWGFSRYVLVC